MLIPADTIQTILFDFDYTLVDSSRGATECINAALISLGLAPVRRSAACQTIGLSLQEAFLRLVGHQYQHLAELFERRFIDHADRVMLAHTSLLAPVRSTVEQLKQAGFTLGIVSTNLSYRIEALLEREQLRPAFSAITGGEQVTRHKPDPEGLLMTIARLGGVPAQTMYVGDSLTDAETARRAGVSFTAVLSGVTPGSYFAEHPVAHMLEDLSELTDLFCGRAYSAA